MHCLVFTDTDLYSLTKGKSYLAKQKWRRSTCLRDQCYDVGCHPCDFQLVELVLSNYGSKKFKTLNVLCKARQPFLKLLVFLFSTLHSD